jgi:cob(I)alamin adenosyltransferase
MTATAQGLFLIFTGNGKGKTTAGLGLAFRALGHGYPVAILQFIKGKWACGESAFAANFSDLLEFHTIGRGFTWKSDDLEKDIAVAREAWAKAQELITANRHRLIILDELTYLVKYNMVDEQEILQTIAGRPTGMHVVVTGRDASQAMIDQADLVTEMREIKHPYAGGVEAQRGIEF